VQVIAAGPVLFDTVFAAETASFIHSFIHSCPLVLEGVAKRALSSATIVDRTSKGAGAGCRVQGAGCRRVLGGLGCLQWDSVCGSSVDWIRRTRACKDADVLHS
jgi:hypothetical protein